MSSFPDIRRIAHLQLDAARHFFLIIHNGDQLHLSGDLSMNDFATALTITCKGQGFTRQEFVSLLQDKVREVYDGHMDTQSPITTK